MTKIITTIVKKRSGCCKKYHEKRGAILLISITVASLVLAIGLGILNITTKEIILSSYGKESGKAFYAADTGIECALFWDIGYANSILALSRSPFATSSVLSLSESGINLDCAGQKFNDHTDPDFQEWDIASSTKSATTTFKFSTWSADPLYGDNPPHIDNPCVEVIIEKYQQNVGLPDPIIRTRISSIGYNTCDESKKRRVSRGVRVQY